MLPLVLKLPVKLYERARVLQQHVQSHRFRCPPEWEKHDYIRRWAKVTGYRTFIETGTYFGNTTAAVADVFDRCITIEYDETLYQHALAKFGGRSNVTVYHGDSGVLMGEIVPTLTEPAIFWLDAHYCGGMSARSPKNPPVWQELDAVLAHPIKDHIIMIDDSRWFTGTGNYPGIRKLDAHVKRSDGGYQVTISHDIIHIYREFNDIARTP